MPRNIRFHLDENCSSALSAGLRQRGIDVTTTPETGLLNATDEQQLAFATANGRVLVTHDTDFLAHSSVAHAGIAYCHQAKYSLGDLIRALVLVWEVYEPSEMHNRIEYL